MIRIFERTSIAEHRLPSIAKDSTGGGPLTVITGSAEEIAVQKAHAGILRNVDISCDSTDFNLTLRNKRDSTANSIDEIYKYTGGNLRVVVDDLYKAWVNNDNPKTGTLYATVVNKDLQNPTGVIRIRLTNDINRRFTGGR